MQPSRQGLGNWSSRKPNWRIPRNTEIVGMVRGLEVTPEELATIIQAIRSGNMGGLSVAAQNPEEQEELDDEE